MPIAASMLAVLGLAGCGSSSKRYLNAPKVERGIAQSALVERHFYARVSCPTRIPQEQSYKFQCSALFDVGSYKVSVTEVDGNGHVRWSTRAPVSMLNIPRVASAIRAAVFKERGVQSTVRCPSEVLQSEGLHFTCTAVVRTGSAKVKTGRYPFAVREVDGYGHVTFLGT